MRSPCANNKLNFISLTPSTSLDQRVGHGAASERKVLYHLLTQSIDGGMALRTLLQGNVRDAQRWRESLERCADTELDPEIDVRFQAALRHAPELKARLESMLTVIGRRQNLTAVELKERRDLVGELRRLLAEVSLRALQPDLIVLDEFQRFKHLLSPPDEEDDTAALAQFLFKYKAPEGHRARVLLLSATPYKMYSTDGEVGADDHYPDFIETTQFLMDGDQARCKCFEDKLRSYRRGMVSALHGDAGSLLAAKQAVEGELRRIMVRTERVAATKDRQSMVAEPLLDVELSAGDVQQYLAADALARAVGEPEPIEYWKSAPYLLSFMSGYKLQQRIEDALEQPDLQAALHAHPAAHLQASAILAYDKVDPGNARLRRLIDDMVGGDAHQLLWVPPSLPYWSLQGPFATRPTYSKALVFSAWNVVPDVVSALLSYEVERRTFASRRLEYEGLHKQVSRHLEFKISDGRLAGMPVLAMLYPSATLAEAVDPLRLFKSGAADPMAAATVTTSELVHKLKPLARSDGPGDERWYWAAPLLLDVLAGKPTQVLHDEVWGARHDDDEEQGSTRLGEHLAQLRKVVDQTLHPALGPFPEDLPTVLAELALGGLGVCALRAFRWTGVALPERQAAAVLLAEGLRSVFNHPTAVPPVSELYGEPYWRATLRYAIAGNLQAVLDEYLHQVWEQGGWSRHASGQALREAALEMAGAVQLRSSRIKAQPVVRSNGNLALGSLNIRTDFARRYGTQASDDDNKVATEVAVRNAFNSPFRPFVLVSTSVGQEGLDFHPWCHILYHWNLPGNPVDLEQREGRVHRYKGHAVRRNLAERYGAVLREALADGEDPWARLFALAEAGREQGQSELVPHWLFDGTHCVERRVPVLPFSKDAERLLRLRKELAAYRLVFGQPRQQELLELIKGTTLSVEAMGEWAIDLRPMG